MKTGSATPARAGVVPVHRGRAFSSAAAWSNAWRRSARRWQVLAPRIAAATGWKIWNPGLYGEPWHALFRDTYPPGSGSLLVLGLNPGPYGMAQTGIPFTDIKRLGQCLPRLAQRIEQRGRSLDLPGLAPRGLRPYLSRTFESSAIRVYRFLSYGWGSAEAGWRNVAVANPCPLLFIDPRGKNCTPADLFAAASRRTGSRALAEAIRDRCDRLRRQAAREAVQALRPRGAILLGKDAQRALGEEMKRLLGKDGVLEWEHPARAVPDRWARGLLAAIQRRGWK